MSQRVTNSRFINIFRLLKEAVNGEEKEYTTGSIDRAIFMLSIPMILEMSMESLFALADAFFVSRLGTDAIATVGLTESLLFVVYSLAIGVSMGTTAVVARRTGEKNKDGAAHAGMQAIYIGVALSILIGIVGIVFAKDLLKLMGGSPELIEENYLYTVILLGSNVVILLLFLINGIFRGAGDASIAMRSLWLANLLNIVLDPLLIYGLGPIEGMGLKGAAIATAIGRGTGVLYQIYHLYKGKGMIKVLRKHMGIDVPIIGNLLRLSLGGTAQFLIASASWIFLVRIIAKFGSNAIAGYTIGIRMIGFTILPAWGMSNAAATLVGQNLGAKQPERAEQSVWRTAFFNMIFLVSVAIVFTIFAPWIIGIFSTEPEVLKYGIECLRYVCAGYLFYGYGMVLAQSFNGAGDTKTPTIINFFGFWVFQIPLAYVLANSLAWGPKGVFWAIAIAESAMAIAAMLIFRRGKWKTIEV
ncbi:MAG: MATE family efflux transporter [Chitinophagales bacterium]|nr:MATE family efflux transporter [Chitinophagaceae bacterium]MCB9065961.1 MATE family efflux transporter [Chitinophagales bacterium]